MTDRWRTCAPVVVVIGGDVAGGSSAWFLAKAGMPVVRCETGRIGGGLVHHSDRGVRDVSITDSGRLTDAGIAPSAGSVGDSEACPRAGAAGPRGTMSSPGP